MFSQPLLRRFLLSTSLLFVLQSGAASAQSMPTGHPPAGHPQAGAMKNGRPQNSSTPDPELPAGTVQVTVLDSQGLPVPGAQVSLTELFQSIDQGNSENVQRESTKANGVVLFDGLKTGLRMSHQVRVESQGAHYEVSAFRLGNTGQAVTIFVYPTTSDIKAAFVGFRGLTYIQMREDFFQVSAMYRVLNMSDKTYLPQGITIQLPQEAQAIDVETKVGDAGFEKAGKQVSLVGTFPPGHKDLQFTFQIENKNEERLFFELGSPPHLAEQRVLVEETPGMELSVAGFGATESTAGPDGKQVLFAQKIMRTGEEQLGSIRVELGGLPTIGPGRWFALALAACIGLGGLVLALLRLDPKTASSEAQKDAARQVLLDEMKLLETARKTDKIGPRTYEQTKKEILLALARLGSKAKATT